MQKGVTMWSFETDPDYQADLDWADNFVREEVEPLEFVIPSILDIRDPVRQELIPPLQASRRAVGTTPPRTWRQGTAGELAFTRSSAVSLSPFSAGAAPDTGNAEIIAHWHGGAQTARLQPLLDGQIFSSYSMTEPQGGSDPKVFTCRAERDGDHWVINGEKWFSGNANWASFLIVMVITDPDNPPYLQPP
jgi:acyl-CoA dehydrogenase